jgi:hypothetical protein
VRSSEEDEMNLLTLIGNATVDDDFRNELFEHPFETVKKYGVKLTRDEDEALKILTGPKHGTENKNYLREVYVCPRRPCAIALKPEVPQPGPPPEPLDAQQKIA